MRTSTCILALAVLAASIVFQPAASVAAPELSVDFGRLISGNPTPVQSGFNGMAGDPVQASKTEVFGAYTVTVEGEGFYSAGFNAGNVHPRVAALYEDYYYHNSTTNGVGVSLSIDGVIPNTPYFLTLWSYDEDNIFSLTDTVWGPDGDTSGTSETITNFATPYPNTLAFNRTRLKLTSTTSTLEAFGTTTSGGGGTRLNGFRLSFVPEPGAGIMAALGAMMMTGLGRRFRPRR
jgi:hypothetical protein